MIRTKPIRRRSRKKAASMRTCRNILAEKFGMHGCACQIRSEVCTGLANGLHHLKKKSQGGEDTHENTILACNPCNTYIEDHPAWALAHGFTIRREDSTPTS